MQNTILSGTINNAIITLGNIDDTGKGRHFTSRFIKDGLVKIEGHGVVLLKKETLDASLPSMIGTPVIIKHQDVTKKNADRLRCGTISNAYFNEPDGWYYCEGIIWDEDAQELIENQGWSVSCSYDFLSYNDEGGVENNIPYDKEFTQLNFTHLAIVDNPRYERANIVFNSKVNNEDKWITIHPNGEDGKGRHLLLKDGETPKEAIDRTYGKGEKSDTKEESKKSKIDFSEYSDAELEHAIDVYKSNLSTAMEYGDDQYNTEKDMLSEIEKELGRRKAKSDTKDEKKDKYIGKKFFIGDREDEITEYLPQFDRYMGKNPEGLNWGAQLYTKDDLDKYYIKSDEEYLKEKELREKQKAEREQAQKKKEEEEKAAHAEYIRDNGFTEGMTDLQKGKTLKDLNKEVWYKQVNDGKPTTSKKMIEELIGKGFKPKEETFRTTKKINGERIDKDTVSKILEDKDGNFYNLNSTEYKYAQYLRQFINGINNNKEQDMALLEEIKKLISKVENSKENDMEIDEKIENETVDKRKLIDEVAGIMKSAGCDDEDIRTAIGKMEKIGYDKSEAGSADNKKVKNEDEKDKKEVKDLKDDMKKDVDNKCKNSKDESTFDKINAIYNSIKLVKEESKYTSRQEKLDAAKEYFS